MKITGLILGCLLTVASATPPPPQKLTVARRSGEIVAECVMVVPTPTPRPTNTPGPTPTAHPTAKPGELTWTTDSTLFSAWSVSLPDPRYIVRDCKLMNGATWDDVMQAMCVALNGC